MTVERMIEILEQMPKSHQVYYIYDKNNRHRIDAIAEGPDERVSLYDVEERDSEAQRKS